MIYSELIFSAPFIVTYQVIVLTFLTKIEILFTIEVYKITNNKNPLFLEYYIIMEIKRYLSWAILKHLVLKKHIEQVLCCQGLWYPSWNLNIKIFLSCSLWKDFFKFIDKSFILSFEVVDHFVLVFNMSFKLSDLMLVAVYLIILNVLQLFNFSLAGTFLTFSLTLNQSSILIFFCLPPC